MCIEDVKEPASHPNDLIFSCWAVQIDIYKIIAELQVNHC